MVVLVGNGQGWPHPGWRLIKGPPFHLAVVLLLWGQSRSVALLRPFKPILYKKQTGTQREKKHVLTLTLMLVRRKSACKTSARSSKILPHFGVHIWTQKWGQPSEISLLPAHVVQADLRPCSLNMNVNCASQVRLLETNWDPCINTYAHGASQICLQNLCAQQQNSPMADPTFGSKSGSQNGAQAKT